MKVEGELNSFYPPDLLIFLAHLKKEGILTSAEGASLITLTLTRDHLVDAQSEIADGKILKSLFRSGAVNLKTYRYLCRARQETNISVRRSMPPFPGTWTDRSDGLSVT